jgi:hypothetical protein
LPDHPRLAHKSHETSPHGKKGGLGGCWANYPKLARQRPAQPT